MQDDDQHEATPDPATAGEDGFVLLVVIWVAALLALAAAALSSSSLDYVRATRNEIASERVKLLSEAGVRLGMLALTAAETATDRPPSPPVGTTACTLPDGETLLLTITDEAGKVDLNTANDTLLLALLTGAGATETDAAKLVEVIGDYRDADSAKRVNGAERDEYRAAGRSGPKNAGFDSVVELGAVIGIDQTLFRRLLPYVTVHSGQSGIDPDFAADDLLDILSRARSTFAGADALTVRDRQISSALVSVTTAQSFAIRAEAVSSAARYATEAVVVRIERAPSPGRRPANVNDSVPARARPVAGRRSGPAVDYQIMEWRRALPAATPVAPTALPPQKRSDC